MNDLILLARNNRDHIEFNYRRVASLASNGMPLKKAFQRVYPGAKVPSPAQIRKNIASEMEPRRKPRDFGGRKSYLKDSGASFESHDDVTEFARKGGDRAKHNAAMREKYGPEWYKDKSRRYQPPKPKGKKSRIQKKPDLSDAKPAFRTFGKKKPGMQILTKRAKNMLRGKKAMLGYGLLGGAAFGGAASHYARRKKD